MIERDRFDLRPHPKTGKVKTGLLLWALGVPLPFVLLFVLLRGCF